MHGEHGCMHQRKLNLWNDQDYLHIYVRELNHSKISHYTVSIVMCYLYQPHFQALYSQLFNVTYWRLGSLGDEAMILFIGSWVCCYSPTHPQSKTKDLLKCQTELVNTQQAAATAQQTLGEMQAVCQQLDEVRHQCLHTTIGPTEYIILFVCTYYGRNIL